MKHIVFPWSRLLARYLDISLFGAVYALLFFHPWAGGTPPKLGMFTFLKVLVFLISLEALLLSTWGTTPGKWLLNISVRTPGGEVLQPVAALKRAFLVWGQGMWFGFPLLDMIPQAIAYRILRRDGVTWWDAAGGVAVTQDRPPMLRFVAAVGLIIFLQAIKFVSFDGMSLLSRAGASPLL